MVYGIMEIVHDGWLLKSPPPKRLWRAKWRNRWFVLRSGELPGQYFLEYYTDDSRKKLKGKIDLDQCEQVDAGITFLERKFDYKFMFDIKTPKRIYYLCAETEEQMNRWVDCVCQVCGLKVMSQDNFYSPLVQLNPIAGASGSTPPLNFDPHRLIEYPEIDSPPPSASSIISGPYIPISECITGKKSHGGTKFPFLHDAQSNESQRCSIPNEMAPPAPLIGTKPRESYDVPRQLRPSFEETSSLQSPISTEGSTILSDEEKSQEGNPPSYQAPPRPPKPPHLSDASQQNYMNLDTLMRSANVRHNSLNEKNKNTVVQGSSHLTIPETSISSSDAEPSPASVSNNSVPPNTPKEITDEMYDFPRSHQADLVAVNTVFERNRRHCYNNCAPAAKLQGKIFSYDTHREPNDKNVAETDSTQLPQSNYTNFNTPPIVDRGNKPRKLNEPPNSISTSELSPPLSGNDIPSISISASGSIPVPPASAPPIVDRNRKPKISEPCSSVSNSSFVLDPAPRSRLQLSNNDIRKPRAAPSPTPPNRNGKEDDSDTDDVDSVNSPGSRRDSAADEQIFFPLPFVQRRSSNEIQYLDLDLETQSHSTLQASPKVAKSTSKFVPCESSIIYKKVDFVKTEAFNKMRQNVEEGYRKYQE